MVQRPHFLVLGADESPHFLISARLAGNPMGLYVPLCKFNQICIGGRLYETALAELRSPGALTSWGDATSRSLGSG